MEALSDKDTELQKLTQEIDTLRTTSQSLEDEIGTSTNRNFTTSTKCVEQLKAMLEDQSTQNQDLRNVIEELEKANAKLSGEDNEGEKDGFDSNGDLLLQENDDLKRKLKAAEDNYELLQRQSVALSNEANKKNNDLQNQLQGVESVGLTL